MVNWNLVTVRGKLKWSLKPGYCPRSVAGKLKFHYCPKCSQAIHFKFHTNQVNLNWNFVTVRGIFCLKWLPNAAQSKGIQQKQLKTTQKISAASRPKQPPHLRTVFSVSISHALSQPDGVVVSDSQSVHTWEELETSTTTCTCTCTTSVGCGRPPFGRGWSRYS